MTCENSARTTTAPEPARTWRKAGAAILGALLLTTVRGATAAGDPPVGTWTTIDDDSGKPRALVRIEELDGALSGRIVRLFRDPGEDPAPLCKECSGARHDRPVIGMTILWNMHRHGDDWTGGEILDPETGKIYRCTLHLAADGMQLDVRGFIGISLLGRTQVWRRAADP